MAVLVIALVVGFGPTPARAEDVSIDHVRLVAVGSAGDVLIVHTRGRLAPEDTDDEADTYRQDVASGSFDLIPTTEPEHEDESVDVVAVSPSARYLVWGIFSTGADGYEPYYRYDTETGRVTPMGRIQLDANNSIPVKGVTDDGRVLLSLEPLGGKQPPPLDGHELALFDPVDGSILDVTGPRLAGIVSSAVMSPQGDRVAYSLADHRPDGRHTAHLADLDEGWTVRVDIDEAGEPIDDLEKMVTGVSPDGARVAMTVFDSTVPDGNRGVLVRDVSAGRSVRRHDLPARLAFADEGRYLVGSDADGDPVVSDTELRIVVDIAEIVPWDDAWSLRESPTVAGGTIWFSVFDDDVNDYAVIGREWDPAPLDAYGSRYLADIEWLAGTEITRGCNPPANTLFCPDAEVTRGQMAAFLVRALGLTGTGDDAFGDDDSSVFEGDIDALAAAGVARGCNPPANDRFCPTESLTRGQMAALLVRALGYIDGGGDDLFGDDDGSVFETDIDRLATAGVTRGCNPPANDRFCPERSITRAEMAAMLHRALG